MASCKLCGENECKCGGVVKAKFCPRCKSMRVGYVFEFGNIFGLIPRMRCHKCGFSAMEFPLLVIGKNRLNEIINKRKKSKTKKSINKRRKKR